MFAWNPWSIADILAVATTYALAGIVFGTAPSRSQNRRLAVFLVVMGTLRGGIALQTLADDPASFVAATRVVLVAWLAVFPAYLAFLSTVPSPLSRPLRTPAVRFFIIALVAAIPALFIALRSNFPPPGPFTPDLHYRYGFASAVDAALGAATLLLVLYSLSIAVTALRVAPSGSLARAKAVSYALAFGAFDFFWIIYFVCIPPQAMGVWVLPRPLAHGLFVGAGVVEVWLVAFLAIGILRTQVLDLDLRLKWTLRRGAVASAFLLVFLVVSQLIERWASESLGYLSGAGAAALLLLALQPIQNAAARLAERAMPEVHATPDYLAYRRMAIYEAALREMLDDMELSEKDHRVLTRLRGQLGLAEADAAALERQVRMGLAAPAKDGAVATAA